ncbi:MAG: 50S ribosomal protein L18 [Tenericutes bacterium ADurb.Bin239]|jgi:large subunit ribosomal protein L18|nr:MAG: 50S ribosomal protein L18 [Tenericutes bacterium ADurb.Bin239]
MVKQIKRNEIRKRRHARIRRKISGTADIPRLVVFRSNKHIAVQLIDDTKGVTLGSASSLQLKLDHGDNIESAIKVGQEIASVAKKLGIEKVVFDRGGYLYHGRIKALADAAREAGLVF